MDFSLVGMWKSMGLPARLVVITLAIMSVYSLSVMAERLFSYSRAKDQSRKYAEKLRDLLPGHQMIDAAQMASTMKYGHIPPVLGIITAFQLMATSGSGGLASVSAGISEALITTAFGLLVAIPALMMYNYLTNRVEEMSVDIADASNELVDFFLKEGRFEEPLTNPGTTKTATATAPAKA